MSFEGKLYVMPLAEWHDAFPELPPEDCGLRRGVVLGTPAVCFYHGAGYGDGEGEGDDFDAFDLARQHDYLLSMLEQIRTQGIDGVLKRVHIWQSDVCMADVEAALREVEADPNFARSRQCLDAFNRFLKIAESHVLWE